MKRWDIIGAGEYLIDLTQTGADPAGVPQFAANPGGAPANVAVAAARLGARTAFWGKVGADGFGRYLRQVLAENGVDAAALQTGPGHTTLAVVSVNAAGERDFQFLRGADCAWRAEEVDTAAIAQTKVFHFGSVSLTAGPARCATLLAARTAREQGVLVSYDPNYRAPLWPDEKTARRWMALPLPLVHILKVSEEEAAMLTGARDPAVAAQVLESFGVRLVLVTLGDKGALCRWQKESYVLPAVPVSIADTNGAGDTFLAAVLARLCRRGERPLEGLTGREVQDIVAWANRAAAVTCSRPGAIPAMPTLAELM